MRIEVDLPTQALTLYGDAGDVLRRYRVSTAKNGPGERNGSFCTPRGRHLIRAKIGAGEPENTRAAGAIPGPRLDADADPVAFRLRAGA
jgi:L,D-transpeptidase YbiS